MIEADFGLILALTLVAVGLSAISGLIRPKRAKTPFIDEREPTTASRGAFISRLFGARIVGPLIAWVGNRTDPTGAEKRESTLHILCLGADIDDFSAATVRVTEIYINGERVVEFQGLDAVKNKQDITIKGVNEGTLWFSSGTGAHPDCPLFNSVFDADGTKINSKWFKLAWIYWENKFLGESYQWPDIQYEIRYIPTGRAVYDANNTSEITIQSSPQFYPLNAPVLLYGARTNYTLIVPRFPGTANLAPQQAIIGNFLVVGGAAEIWKIDNAGKEFDKDGQIKARIYITASSTIMNINVIKVWKPNADHVHLEIAEDLEDIIEPQANKVQPFIEAPNIGINPIVILDELLFAAYPYGRGLNPSLFNLGTFKDASTILYDERFVASYLASDEEGLDEIISTVLDEIGGQLYLDHATGLYTLKLIRPYSVEEVTTIPLDMAITGNEIENLVGEVRANRVEFVIKSRFLRYREFTVPYQNEALAHLFAPKTERIDLKTATDEFTAQNIASRKGPEIVSQLEAFELSVNREGINLYPGQIIYLQDQEHVYRVASVQAIQLSGEVKLKVVLDIYGLSL